MLRVTATCDKCKKEAVQTGNYFSERNVEWQKVEIAISQYEHKDYLFCKECRKELGLIRAEGAKRATVESVEERLLNVICEIVAGQLENRE